jgi:hypothetical protein
MIPILIEIKTTRQQRPLTSERSKALSLNVQNFLLSTAEQDSNT